MKAKTPKKGWIITLRTGEKFVITSVSDRFYICGITRFRKVNPDIISIEPPEKKTPAATEMKGE